MRLLDGRWERLKYRADFDDYGKKSNKHSELHEWKVKTGLTEDFLKMFADSMQEGGTYRLHVEKILIMQDSKARSDPAAKKEWVYGELIKKYPHIELFRIGKRRRETFMYKDLYNMARECGRL